MSALDRVLAFTYGSRAPAAILRPDTLMPGVHLGPVRIERRIGRGATSTIYVAGQADSDQLVAVKALHWPEPGGDEAAWLRDSDRFLQAAQQAMRLDHPGIGRVFGGGRSQGVVFVVLELLSGRDLSHYTQPSRLLPEPVVLDIAARLAEALAYAHRSGVVHRDVKPANVMYDPARRQVKLTDFGLARDADAQATRSGTLVGSPVYMAPELLSGGRADSASDLYGLGVLAFELLTGQLPYAGASMGELLRGIAQAPPMSVVELRPDLARDHAEALDALLGTLLAKLPRERIDGGDAWAAAARAVLARWRA